MSKLVLLALFGASLGLLGCSASVGVIRSPGAPRPAYDGDVSVRFLETPPGATEVARLDTMVTGLELAPALEPLVVKTAELGGNLTKIDSVDSVIEQEISTDNQGKTHASLRFKTRIRGRAFYVAEAGAK